MRITLPNWLTEVEPRRLGYQLLLLLLSSGVTTLALSLLPLSKYLESQLYDFRLYFQMGQRSPHQDFLLLHLNPAEGPEFIKTLNQLPARSFKAIGLDTPRLFHKKQLSALKQLEQHSLTPIVLAASLAPEKQGSPQRLRHPLAASVSEGFNFYPTDFDGTIRSQPLLMRYLSPSPTKKAAKGKLAYKPQPRLRQLPSFAYALYRQLEPDQPLSVNERYLAYPGTDVTYNSLNFKEFQALSPAERQGKILLVSDQNNPIKGRTPFQASVSPLELHAYALAGLLENRSFVRPKLLNALLPVLLPLLGLGMLWLSLRWGLLVAAASLLLLLFSYFTFNLLLFQQAIWLDLLIPVAATLAGTGSVVLHFHRTEGQTRRELYSTFRRHLPEQVARALLEQQTDGLTNERRIVTVMFTDIQGFSRMGEKLPPDQIIQILNEYFAAMTEIVFANQGSLDKYIGDGLMAVYGNIGSNNPKQDAHYAVKTALEMQDKMAELQKKWMKEGIRPIQIRIGINTGEALVGQVGHPRRKEMTVIGDTVNTAARIEKLNKQYHTHILISHSTYEYIKEWAEVRPLGEEQLIGKSSSVMVYELKGRKAQQLV